MIVAAIYALATASNEISSSLTALFPVSSPDALRKST